MLVSKFISMYKTRNGFHKLPKNTQLAPWMHLSNCSGRCVI